MRRSFITYVPIYSILSLAILAMNTPAQKPPDKEITVAPDTKQWSPTEQELWKLEQTYIQYLAAGEVDSMKPFYHEKFLGWPSHSAEPVNRDAGESSLRALLKELKILDHTFQPCAMVMYEKTAIVHYKVEFTIAGQEGKQSTVRYRIIHTWLNEGGKWKILGGMSAER